MPLPVTLPVSRLINVAVSLAPPAAQGQSLNSLLILEDTNVIDVVERMRSYLTLAAVAADFGTSDPAYLAAVLWFEQNPQPTSLLIGRWAKASSHGQLRGAPLSSANQQLSVWNAITNGGINFTVDGAPHNLAGLNFSAAANMNAVAAIIQTGLGASATIVWNATYSRFEVQSASTGAASIVAFCTAGAGTDISALTGLTVGSVGAYQANGIVAESASAAVTILDNKFGQQWYGLTILGAADADHSAVGQLIEGMTNKHFYGVTTQEATVLTPGDTTDIAYILQQLALNHTCVQYSSSNPYAVVSLLARILTTNYQGNSTVITLMYQQEPGIVAENLTATQIAALEAKNCNVFVAYNNNTAIIEPGVSSSGNFIDAVMGTDALAVAIQTAIYNLLFTAVTKIPLTDAGINQIVGAIAAVCAQFVTNGLLAPGNWTSNGFGQLASGGFMPKGFYIFAPPVSSLSQAQRSARQSPLIQIAAKLAGAVHDVNVSISVNQ